MTHLFNVISGAVIDQQQAAGWCTSSASFFWRSIASFRVLMVIETSHVLIDVLIVDARREIKSNAFRFVLMLRSGFSACRSHLNGTSRKGFMNGAKRIKLNFIGGC